MDEATAHLSTRTRTLVRKAGDRASTTEKAVTAFATAARVAVEAFDAESRHLPDDDYEAAYAECGLRSVLDRATWMQDALEALTGDRAA